MAQVRWSEVTRAAEENRHELILSDEDVARRYQESSGGLDMRIFQIETLNFLEISNIDLTDIPEEIGDLVNMKNLALQRNKIKSIPSSIGSLKSIKFLDVSWNKLVEVPETLGTLPILHTLNLSCNDLESLPSFESLQCLVILHIDHNKLQGLPEGIYGLEHLNEIHASHNHITEIKEEINQIESLKLLDVSNNKLKELPGQLADCPRLKDLNLKDNPLTDNRLRKMTSQCSTRSIMEYIASHSGQQSKGKKGKKKKQGKGSEKESDKGGNVKKIHVIHNSKEGKNVIFKDAVKGIRQFITCAVVRNLDLSDLQMYKKFIALQTKLHDTICDSRTTATIATHNAGSLVYPLIYSAKKPDEVEIFPLGGTSQMLASEYVAKLYAQKDSEEKKKKRQQTSGVYRFLDLLQGQELYPCLISDNKVISLPPITNSDTTKISPSICDVFIEVTSSVSLAACKGPMEQLIEQLFRLGYISSPYSGATSSEEEKHLKGLILEQVRVDNEDGQLRVMYPSRVDLQFDDIEVAFLE